MTSFRRWFAPAAALVLSHSPATAQQYLISTFAGGMPAPTAAVATSYPLGAVNAVASDRFGNTYVSSGLNCVFRVDASGMVERVAGTGQAGFSGDGGNALNAQLNSPQGVALDTAGNLYIADQYNQRIRMVSLDGIITTVAGNGTAGYNGDGEPASSAELYYPQGITTDGAGNLYIADLGNGRIRMVSADGSIATVAGGGTGSSGDGGPATSATLTGPNAVALDAAGDLYIADATNQVRVVNPAGVIAHFAGTGLRGYSGDGGLAASAALSDPVGLVVDPTGNVYIADESNQRVRKVNLHGIITTFAGGNSNVALGDGGPATSARLYAPVGVSADTSGDIYIADQSNDRLREVNPTGTISTAAGTGAILFGGDGGPAALAQFSAPRGIARDGSGNLYISDPGNLRVRSIAASGVVTTFAGTGSCCNLANGEAATSASIDPDSIAVDGAGNVYVGNLASVAEVAATGSIALVAGTGIPGNSGIGGPAVDATLSASIPGVAVDHNNDIYLTDYIDQLVLEVNSSGTINAVAGTGMAGYSGDGGLGTSEELNYPGDLALDASRQNLYIVDSGNNRIRELASNGTISTVAGNGGGVNSGDGGPATAAGIAGPAGIVLDRAGNLYIATAANTIRMVSSGATITTIAGTGGQGYSGDGGPALSARFSGPLGMVADPAGNIYICDSGNHAIRVLQPVGTAPVFTVSTTQGGNFTAGEMGAAYQVVVSNAALAGPTTSQVTFTEIVPSGLTLASMFGDGWLCSSNTCTRSDELLAGNPYPAISIVVNVDAGAPPQVTNAVTVTGGGSLGAASSIATFIGPPVPALEITATNSGMFFAGQSAAYTVTVGNQTGAATTTTPVTVTEDLPSPGLTLASMSGMGWICSSNSCSRSDPLPGGSGYSPIDVLVTVSSPAPAQVTNQVTVSGGGSISATTSVTTSVSTVACNLNGSPANITDVQILINEALGVVAASDDLNQDGVVNLTDVQIEINAALGFNCTI
jgi:sugar lactone lactonase YvrE